MKNVYLILLACFTLNFGYAQTAQIPKNLKQAIRFLNKDCTDSLKTLIRQTPDDKLKNISYPWGGQYKTVYEWISNKNSPISTYLESKGIFSHQEIVILLTFKRHLTGKEINESEILKPYKDIEAVWRKEDNQRFTRDSLRGVYIPKDVNDAFVQIDQFWPDSTKTKLGLLTENQFASDLHLSFGTWMRNNWGLWQGSRLSDYFIKNGVRHPESMSAIILTSYHRHLNKKPIQIEEQLKSSKEYDDKAQISQKEHTLKEFYNYKIGDTILYKYRFGYSSKSQEDKFNNDSCVAKGVILGKNNIKLQIKIKLLTSCDKKGIITYDSNEVIAYDRNGKIFTPKKRIVKVLKPGNQEWFYYNMWEIIE